MNAVFRCISAAVVLPFLFTAVLKEFSSPAFAGGDRSPEKVASFHERSKKMLSADHNEQLFAKYTKALQQYEAEIFDTIFLKALSPIPRTCAPVTGRPTLYVLSPTDLLVVRQQELVEHERFFDLRGLILLDLDENGSPEAYGFGWERLPNGAGLSSEGSAGHTDNTTPELIENFASGLTLIPWVSPTLFINMAEWSCKTAHHINGDVEVK